MYNWFECKIKYDKTGDDGIIKTVTEAIWLMPFRLQKLKQE
jgi:hypothetical protein